MQNRTSLLGSADIDWVRHKRPVTIDITTNRRSWIYPFWTQTGSVTVVGLDYSLSAWRCFDRSSLHKFRVFFFGPNAADGCDEMITNTLHYFADFQCSTFSAQSLCTAVASTIFSPFILGQAYCGSHIRLSYSNVNRCVRPFEHVLLPHMPFASRRALPGSPSILSVPGCTLDHPCASDLVCGALGRCLSHISGRHEPLLGGKCPQPGLS